MKLPKIRCVKRFEYLIENCTGKNVLHLGCASMPTTKPRYEQNRLLHVLISKVTNELWGVDLNSEAIEYLKTKEIPNLYTGDVEKLTEAGLPSEKKFDVILAGELIEHLSNPGLFLAECLKLLKPEGELILSTPNAFTIKRAPRVLLRNEATAPDHTFYSTYSTLNQLLSRSGFEIVDIQVYYLEGDLYLNQPIKSKISSAILRRLPLFNYFADGFVLKARAVQL